MDELRVKGMIDEVVGNAKKHVGALTGNTGTQVKGAVQQLKGKAENVVGKAKDAFREANNKPIAPRATSKEAQREDRKAAL
jgi:uncharacterized protein YjbJ (UPF0337 family)